MQKYITQQGLDILNRTDTRKLSKDVQNAIANSSYFFLATSSSTANPNINFKGGERGFVNILNEHTLLFPDFDGNGIFHGLNDIDDNPNIAMLFIDFVQDIRYKVHGIATIIDNKETMNKYIDFKGFDYAPRAIQVDVTYVIGNCSKYIENVRRDILNFENK